MRYRQLLILLLLLCGGCSLLPTASDEPVVVEPPLPPQPVAEPRPEPAPPPSAPAPAPEPAPAPVAPPHKVAIVLSSRASAYEAVATALAGRIDDVEVYDLSDRSLLARDAFAAIHATGRTAIVAIGLRAAVYARNYADIPVVFSQVFNVADNDLLQDGLRGVSALPPLERQLAQWRAVSPGLKAVGAIAGPGHEALFREAEEAALSLGIDFHGEVAQSDREAFYLFTRMTPKIDGYWLFPDNRILSASVLRDMLGHARQHGVEVTVFNDSLLELGASFSATTVDEDIADKVVMLLDRIRNGELAALPPLTPLSELELQYGGEVRKRLQLAEGQPNGGAR